MTEVRATTFSDVTGYKKDKLFKGKVINGKTYYFYGELSTNPEAEESELDYAALGDLPYLYPIEITYDNKSVVAIKGDIGRGNTTYRPQIDLHTKLAAQLGFKGRGTVKIKAVAI